MVKGKVRIEFAAVVGSGDFPADMLRYDFCSPATEADSYCITAPDRNTQAGFGLRVVVVKRIVARDVVGGDWTPDRWRSFGWSLVVTNPACDNHQDARRAGDGAKQLSDSKMKGRV